MCAPSCRVRVLRTVSGNWSLRRKHVHKSEPLTTQIKCRKISSLPPSLPPSLPLSLTHLLIHSLPHSLIHFLPPFLSLPPPSLPPSVPPSLPPSLLQSRLTEEAPSLTSELTLETKKELHVTHRRGSLPHLRTHSGNKEGAALTHCHSGWGY